MKSFIYEVANDLGIHARPAANLAQACVNLASAITIKCGDKKANGNNVLQILALNAKKGAQLEISAEGGDEEGAIEAIKSVLADEFSKKKKVDILKIAFFGTKDYDRLFFSELAKDKGEGTYNCDIKYFSTRLTPETAGLAKGYDAVCIFVNDEAPREVVETLKECGVKLILLRCAGFNNVDL